MNKSNVNAKSAAATASKKVGSGVSVKQGNSGLSSKSSTECECTYCHEFGHSALEQYCPAMKAAAFFVYEAAMNAKNKKSTTVSGGAKRPKPVGGGGRGGGGGASATAAVPKTVSKFAALSMGDSDSDSETDTDSDSSSVNVVESVVDEYPVLGIGMAIGGVGGGCGMSYRAAIMKSSKPAAVAAVTDGGMTSLKLSGFMKRVRFEDLVSSSVGGGVSMAAPAPAPAPAHAVVYTLPLPPLLVEVKKPWKHNRFVSDWNASSSDDDSDCD
jgi:hypothetical protein